MGSRLKQAQVYAFVAGDGLPFVIHLSHPPKFWEGVTEVAGRPDLRNDPRFRDRHARIRNYEDLEKILKEAFRAAPREQWLKMLEERDVPCAPIRALDEVFEDPQVRHLDRLVAIKDSELGTFQLVKNGANLSATPLDISLNPPKLGEHTDETLTGAGYSAQEIRNFREGGVI